MKIRFLSLAISLFALTASPVFAGVADLTVGCGGDFGMIQDAVNAAGPWATITVCPGDYDENVFVNKDGLTIKSTEVSDRGPNTIVNSFTLGFAPSGGPRWVTITGFTVDCDDDDVGIDSSGNFNKIEYNYVHSCPGLGAIRVNENNLGNLIAHNIVENVSQAGLYRASRAIGPGRNA